MPEEPDVLGRYASAFREMLNARIRGDEAQSIRGLLRLNKEEDWSFVCSAMDVVEDAGEAIKDFLAFGVGGPTKHDSIGEKYLRIYGLLAACYLQQQAVHRLYKLMQCVDPGSVWHSVKHLKIFELRNKLGAHTTTHRETDGSLTCHFLVRVSLSDDFRMIYGDMSRGDTNEVDLRECLQDHLEKMIELLDTVYDKAMKTVYRGRQKDLDRFDKELKLLRVEKAGGWVIRSPVGPHGAEFTVVVQTADPATGT